MPIEGCARRLIDILKRVDAGEAGLRCPRCLLGSVSLTTDGSGAVVSEQKYTAWGVVRAANGAMPTDIGFTGQRLDATGLTFMQARYYDSGLPRFINADTVVPGAGNPQALNRYAYVMGNPLRYTDPNGHCANEVDKDDRRECFGYMNEIRSRYGFEFTEGWRDWSAGDMGGLLEYLKDTVEKRVGGADVVKRIWGGIEIRRYRGANTDNKVCRNNAPACADPTAIHLYSSSLGSNDFSGLLFHEMGHVWDHRAKTQLAQEMKSTTQSYYKETCAFLIFGCSRDYIVGPGPEIREPGYASTDEGEDFAVAFDLWVRPNQKMLTATTQRCNTLYDTITYKG